MTLDLGTSAFKATWVGAGWKLGPVSTVPVRLNKSGSSVTCEPEQYFTAALAALTQAAASAASAGYAPDAIGITSQAQTFVPLDAGGKPVGPAVVWTDSTAASEAEEAARALPEYAASSGFLRPSPLQFLPKVMRLSRSNPGANRFLLLNEWIIYRLTGESIGDTNQQGMSGFWDNARGEWNRDALKLAGIGPENLARVNCAGNLSAPLSRWAQQATGLENIPVYSCGNDQSCAAIGGGVDGSGSLFCNFGTAMVIYGLSSATLLPASESEIAGSAPIPGLFFLLAVVSEVGNVLEEMAAHLYQGDVGRMMAEALAGNDGRAQDVVERYTNRFGELLASMTAKLGRPGEVYAGGGLSRSRSWLQLLESRHGVRLIPCGTTHPGLRGVAKVIGAARGETVGTPI